MSPSQCAGRLWSAARLAPTGFADTRPIATQDTPEARALNRRIELKLTER